MKKVLLPLSLFIVLTLGCHKFVDIDDIWHKHNPDCRIEEIAYDGVAGPDPTIASFSYDHKGRPTAIDFNYVSTGRPNVLFRYNHKGWLQDYIAPYTNNNYEQWYHYEHDVHGRIIADSVFTFGAFINGEPSRDAVIKSAGVYEYDVYERVKKVTRTFDGFNIADEYIYNAQGNMEIQKHYTNGSFTGADTFQFDNKVNLHRTNRIWMFIDRDYSKNNRVGAATFNSSGLPTTYNQPGSQSIEFSFLYAIELERSVITYKCK